MGSSIDLAVSKFGIVEKRFYRANVVLSYDLLESASSDCYERILTDYDSFESYSGRYGDIVPYFELELAESSFPLYESFYREDSLFFIDYLLSLKDSDWLSSELYTHLNYFISIFGKTNLFISVDFLHFKIISRWDIYTKNVYKAIEFLPFDEDGKLLLRALDNLCLYDFKLDNIEIYYEDYQNLGVGESSSYDFLISFDSRIHVERFEKFLETVVPLPDDEFFTERYSRWLIILEHLKHGVKYIYSV